MKLETLLSFLLLNIPIISLGQLAGEYILDTEHWTWEQMHFNTDGTFKYNSHSGNSTILGFGKYTLNRRKLTLSFITPDNSQDCCPDITIKHEASKNDHVVIHMNVLDKHSGEPMTSTQTEVNELKKERIHSSITDHDGKVTYTLPKSIDTIECNIYYTGYRDIKLHIIPDKNYSIDILLSENHCMFYETGVKKEFIIKRKSKRHLIMRENYQDAPFNKYSKLRFIKHLVKQAPM